jgi:hypothetical protein
MTALFTKVAKNSVMSVEEVRRAFLGYTSKGLPGLMTPQPIDAKEAVASARGTWELRSRVINGGQTIHARLDNKKTRARSSLYYEQVGPTEMRELVTMWTDENHYPRDEALQRQSMKQDDTFFIAAFTTSNFRQVDEYTLEYNNTGELIGNYGHYRNPVRGRARVYIMNIDNEATFVSVPETYGYLQQTSLAGTNDQLEPEVPPETCTAGTFLLVNNKVVSGARSFTMSGLPPMFGDVRTMDTTDNYVKVSDQQPLVGGWEPLHTYYARLRNVPEYLEHMKVKANGTAPVHGFYAENHDMLKRYDLA